MVQIITHESIIQAVPMATLMHESRTKIMTAIASSTTLRFREPALIRNG